MAFSTGEVALVAEGPLFEGSNTLMGNYTPALEAFLAGQDATLADIQAVTLVGAVLRPAADSVLANIGQITLSMVGDAVGMQEVAVLNPVPAGAQLLELQVAADQQAIAAFFQQPAFTFVADANLLQDQDASLELTGSFDFLITLKSR
ncbi:MAG: hypothetical protein OHK0039_43320 [Bacteroidia bacterium]